MTEYEVLLLLDPELSDEKQAEIVERVKTLVEKDGGSFERHDPWGRRKLAYPVAKKDDGIYHLLTFASPAETLDAAEQAAALVRVEATPLPAVSTIAAALAPDAPLVQDPSLRPDDPLASTNVLREHHYGWGDVDAAATDAEVVVESTYEFPMVTQFAIEPHAFAAAPDGDGVAIWSSIQHPYWLQRVMAGVLGLPLERVRIFAPDPGGAFGRLVDRDFGSVGAWRADLTATAMAGRGWAWTAYDWDERRLFNFLGDAQNTFPVWNATPLVALDVYEHAYFLDYQTDRAGYVDAFLANLDWGVVNGWVDAYRIKA